MNLKSQLRAYLRLRGLSAAELSRRTKVPRQSLSNWLGGLEPRRIDYLKAVADELDTTLDNLLYGTAPEEPRFNRPGVPVSQPLSEGIYEIRLIRVSETQKERV